MRNSLSLRITLYALRLANRCRRGAGRQIGERPVDDLGDLAARGVVVLAEVRPVLTIARLARPAATVAADNAPAVGRLHEAIERASRQHIGKRAAGRVDHPPS